MDVVCYYHAPAKAPLLLAAVLPLAREIAAAGTAVTVERHWLHGPHVRLRLRGPHRHSAAQDAAERLRGHLATMPSTSPGDPVALLHQSILAGRAELVPPPYDPIYPDNTVRIEEPDLAPLAELLGGAGAVECRLDILSAGIDAVETSLRHLGSDHPLSRHSPAAGRLAVVVTGMAAHADNYPYRLAAGYHTFLSHLEDFLFWNRKEELRSRFDSWWDRLGPHAMTLVTAATQRPAGSELAAAWQAWTRDAWQLAETAHTSGQLPGGLSSEYTDRAREFDDRTSLRWDGGRREEVSEYHLRLNEAGFATTAASQRFQVYRFGTNMLYQLLALCDVSPMERYLGASLLSRAAQEISGVSWQDQLAARKAERASLMIERP